MNNYYINEEEIDEILESNIDLEDMFEYFMAQNEKEAK